MRVEIAFNRLLVSVACVLWLFSTMVGAAQGQRSSEATAEFNRGKLMAQKNDLSGAIDSFSKAISLQPNWADAYLQRGYARRMNHQLGQALEDFDKAGELDPRTTQKNRVVAQSYTNQGQILAGELKLEDAINDFDKAIKLFSEDVRPYFERAVARLLLDDLKGAIADYDSYLTYEKNDDFGRARAFAERGLAKHLVGLDKEGAEDVKQSLKLAGDNVSFVLADVDFLERQYLYLREVRSQKRKAIGCLDLRLDMILPAQTKAARILG